MCIFCAYFKEAAVTATGGMPHYSLIESQSMLSAVWGTLEAPRQYCTNHQLIIPGQETHSRGIFSGGEIAFPVTANTGRSAGLEMQQNFLFVK